MSDYVGVEQALDIAKVFANIPGVLRIEVVGSVARDRRGNDLDLVVTVGWYVYLKYMFPLRERLAGVDLYDDFDIYTGVKQDRLEFALKALEFNQAQRGWLELATKYSPLDIHLMPLNWRKDAEEIQTLFNFADTEFVRNIARDAVSLEVFRNENTGLLEPYWP